MRRCKGRKCAGFTLLEILITVVVLSTGLVLVLQGLHSVLYIWDGGVQRTRSLMLAQEQFAQIRHDALRGVAPRSGGEISVEEAVAGHTGLYRVFYRTAHMQAQGQSPYEMLLFLAPAEEEMP